jgi:hypothetical protein
MTLSYAEFLASKRRHVEAAGLHCPPEQVNARLHPWQREIVARAVRVGRFAIWADTGLGKTWMQLEWARLSGRRALIVAPLAVCRQTVAEAAKLGLDVRYARRDGGRGQDRIRITNYELFDRFDPAALDAVVLDESSILKDVTSKTRDKLIAHFRHVPRRLCCSATPAPNDTAELANHAEFLGHATRREMLSTYFVHDQDGWRAKHHARAPMFRWMSKWAVALRRPSDMGYSDDGYVLPKLTIVPHLVPVLNAQVEGQLFPTGIGGIGGRAKVRRATLHARVARAADLVAAEPDEPWLLWCGLNEEADRLTAAVGGVNVHGAMKPEEKADALLAFAAGRIRRLVTKPGIAAFGMNWQHCARMAFVGLSDSYEAYYQSIRRCWRFGQTRPVNAHVVLSDLEAAIADNVARKEREAARFTDDLVNAMRTGTTLEAA